jgi:hypothetical protein
VFSSFVSSITNTMNHLRSMKTSENREFLRLNAYFRRHGISVGLSVRVKKHLDHYINQKANHQKEQDIPLLGMLSEPLKVELHYEVFAPLVRQHPLFEAYEADYTVSVTRICHKAIEEISISTGDVLFSRGEICSQMYFMKSGKMRYVLGETSREGPPLAEDDGLVRGPSSKRYTAASEASESYYLSKGCSSQGSPPFTEDAGVGTLHDVGEDDWMSEAALWSYWIHHGQAAAKNQCTLIALVVDRFLQAVKHNSSSIVSPSHYAAIFINHYNNEDMNKLTDLPLPSFDINWAVRLAWTDIDLAPGTFG